MRRPLSGVEGSHNYMINSDGSTVSDHATATFFDDGEWSSAIEVPAADANFLAIEPYQASTQVHHTR